MPTSFLLQFALQGADLYLWQIVVGYFWQIAIGLVLAIVPALVMYRIMRPQRDSLIQNTDAGTAKLKAETAALVVRDYDDILRILGTLHHSVMTLETEKHNLQMENDDKDKIIQRLKAGETV